MSEIESGRNPCIIEITFLDLSFARFTALLRTKFNTFFRFCVFGNRGDFVIGFLAHGAEFDDKIYSRKPARNALSLSTTLWGLSPLLIESR